MAYQWTTPVRYIRGIGPTRAKELTKIGIHTVGDLLEKQPLSYIYPGGTSIAEAKEGHVVIKARIKSIGRRSQSFAMATLTDDTGQCQAVWYNNPWLLSSLRQGMTVTFWGRFKGGVLQQPKWSTCEASMIDVWGGQYGVHHQTIRAALKEVLSDVELPRMNTGANRANIFKDFHFPDNRNDHKWAEADLKKDEALCLQLALAEKRKGRERQGPPMLFGCKPIINRPEVLQYFPYQLTTNQTTAIRSIERDMCSDYPMQRLIHGEVGSGKTAVAFYAAMLAALNDKRTLILCPTTILAQQHYDTLRGMGWKNVGLHSIKTFLHGDLPHIIIGTHSILYSTDLLRSASLVIVDEFQKFGVKQRGVLQMYSNPHLLLLSATPIPRTLAATVFGDLDVSVIRELPIKRGTVVTKWVLPDRREGMYEIIERELAAGHQAYVVYPRISGEEDTVNAIDGFTEIRRRFGTYSVGLLTGRADGETKATVLQRFRSGETQILVSTVITEVGIDCPNANAMVIMGADRFGLSSLHQCRGRVCRSTSTAFCFLVAETSNPTSIARLEAIERTNDGFALAEEDLRLRGMGEVFSTRQHGLPDLKFISLVDDFDLLQEAKELVASGSVGEGPKKMMELRYGDNLQFGGVV